MKAKDINTWLSVLKKICLVIIVVAIPILVGLSIVSYNKSGFYGENIQVTIAQEWVMIIYAITIVLLLIKYEKYKVLGILGASVAIVGIFNITTFSPIDEAAHFDYVNYIIDNHKIPLVGDLIEQDVLLNVSEANIPGHLNHEGVQPPLYYTLMAVLFGWISSIKIRFYLIRLTGIVFLGIAILYIVKAYKKIVEHNLIEKNDKLMAAIVCAFAFTPGIVTRSLTVSNEGLNMLLSTMIIYYLIKVLVEGYKNKRFYIITLLIVANVLTKNTSIYILGVLILLLIYYRKIKEIGIAILIIVCGVLPWLMFNYRNYGSLTAVQAHLDIVLPIVNPQNLKLGLDYFANAFSRFFSNYFMPSEVTISNIYLSLLSSMGVLVFMTITIQFIEMFKFCFSLIKERFRFSYDKEEKQNVLKIMCLVLILLNILVLLTGSVSTRVGVVIPRYMIISVLPLTLLLYYYVSIQVKNLQKICIILLCIVTSVTHVNANASFVQQKSNILIKFNKKEKLDLNKCIENINTFDCKVSIENGEMLIEAGSIDPQIINLVDMKQIDKEIRGIEIEVEYEYVSVGDIQIFYRSAQDEFSEENSIHHAINYIEKVQKISIPVKRGIEEIRLDPPNGGKLLIKNIMVF